LDLYIHSSISLYHEWGRECYVEKCTRKERMGILWWKAGIWKLRAIRSGFEREKCPLCLGEEDAKHIILECCETKKWREIYVNSNWLNINEDLAYKKITT
jgi:Holliday junction resolvase